MGEYAAIEKEAKLFTELCVHNVPLIRTCLMSSV